MYTHVVCTTPPLTFKHKTVLALNEGWVEVSWEKTQQRFCVYGVISPAIQLCRICIVAYYMAGMVLWGRSLMVV